MKAAGVREIRKELEFRSQDELVKMVLRLSRFKKENKELLTYLLFEAEDEQHYIEGIKSHISQSLKAINTSNLHRAKKAVRKVLRETKKFIRYSGDRETEVQLLLHFCSEMIDQHQKLLRSKVLRDLLERQKLLIKVRISTLHEDLQYDYTRELNLMD